MSLPPDFKSNQPQITSSPSSPSSSAMHSAQNVPQPTIDTFETEPHTESLNPYHESQAKGPISTTPVSNRSYLFQTLFVTIVCFPQVLAEAHIGMLLVPLVDIGRQVGTGDEHQLSWFPASYG